MTGKTQQFLAFLAVVASMLIVAVLPMAASWQLGVSLPDSLLAVADKSTAAFGTLLGTIGALLFRQSASDEEATKNTGEAFRAITAAQNAPTATQDVRVVNEADQPVPTEVT
ncbi:hypothetical protein [Sphingomonas faeni]|uniref:hypothetical protein n=1 Tax=Sphingomonas faeni TaxID=185950 RepID=UPI0033448EA2